MADLSLSTADKVNVEKVIQSLTTFATVAITAGDVITLDPTTGNWVKADANVGGKTQPLYIATKTRAAGLAVTGLRLGNINGWDLSALSYGDPVFLSATAGKLASAIAAVNEVQTLTLSGSPTGGTFILTFRGQATAAIAYNASAADVQTALRALSTIGADGCSVAGSSGGPWTVTFAGQVANEAIEIMTLSTNSLTGGSSPTLGIVETTPGVSKVLVGFVEPAESQSLGSSPSKSLLIVGNALNE